MEIALHLEHPAPIGVPLVTGAVPVGVPEETDPTVPEWAKAPQKPSYTAEEVGAVPVDCPLTNQEIEAMMK